MGKELVALSFFKERNIDYFFDSKQTTIVFPCLCGKQAEMDGNTTIWVCQGCGSNGNLITLSVAIQKQKLPATRIYNPNKEWNEIKKRFDRLIEVNGVEMEELFKKTRDLIFYYKAPG